MFASNSHYIRVVKRICIENLIKVVDLEKRMEAKEKIIEEQKKVIEEKEKEISKLKALLMKSKK